jgi:hypothetical protein
LQYKWVKARSSLWDYSLDWRIWHATSALERDAKSCQWGVIPFISMVRPHFRSGLRSCQQSWNRSYLGTFSPLVKIQMKSNYNLISYICKVVCFKIGKCYNFTNTIWIVVENILPTLVSTAYESFFGPFLASKREV